MSNFGGKKREEKSHDSKAKNVQIDASGETEEAEGAGKAGNIRISEQVGMHTREMKKISRRLVPKRKLYSWFICTRMVKKFRWK